MKSVLHLVIVWSTATAYKDEIVSDIKNNFEFLKTIKVHWDASLFYENLKIFYSHSLKDKSEKEMVRILTDKIKTVGRRDFYVIIFRDNKPQMEQRVTTSGTCVVNTKIFDLKERYRKIVGGSKIHSSNDAWETNKDLSILFGQNSEDFIQNNDIGESYNKNCVGVNGYESLEQLFYILNNTTDYCVLRNFEGIPEQYTLEGHDDIDLLVAHKNYAVRLTNAKPKFPQSYRVYHHILINGVNVAFDFRYVGDNYYDKKWEIDILDSKVLHKDLFYIPSDINRFYSLLYHAYVQKPRIKEDYFPRLGKYAKNIGVEFHKGKLESMLLLYAFMLNMGYSITRADDKSVYFNKLTVLLPDAYYHLKNKGLANLLSVHEDHHSMSGYVYFTGIYKGNMVFVKYGGIGDSCRNEYSFNMRMWSLNKDHYLEPLLFGQNKDNTYIVFRFCKGQSIKEYLSNGGQKELIKSQFIEIYKELQEQHVVHRDIRPENFCVEDDKLKLFDFQFAVDSQEKRELDCLRKNTVLAYSLGDVEHYKYRPYAWRDSFSFLQTSKFLELDVAPTDLSPQDKTIYMNLCDFLIYFIKKSKMDFQQMISNGFRKAARK